MNLFDQRPKLSANVFVAPNASVIGSVEIETQSSVWYVRHQKSEQQQRALPWPWLCRADTQMSAASRPSASGRPLTLSFRPLLRAGMAP